MAEENASGVWRKIGKWKIYLLVAAMVFVPVSYMAFVKTDLFESSFLDAVFKAVKIFDSFESTELLAAQAAVINDPLVRDASVSYFHIDSSSTGRGSNPTAILNAHIFLAEDRVANVELARKLAEVIEANYPKALNESVLQLTLTYKLDFGFFTSSSHAAYIFNLQEEKGGKLN